MLTHTFYEIMDECMNISQRTGRKINFYNKHVFINGEFLAFIGHSYKLTIFITNIHAIQHHYNVGKDVILDKLGFF